ncbi:rhombosortase [Pseudidiomarina tainanensis]|uniref:Rhombosortase n=1 Tax=Pseudidiomarina tainanensis TaxID=502365 RepID=A0ACD2HHU9_9GAMM|nr:rhombosortase [Pseudidiomarina tainanensis]
MPKQSVLPPIVISALLFCCFYFLTPWHDDLLMRYPRVMDGFWWQLITSQFMHHDAPHLWFNIAGVWIAWLLFPDQLKTPHNWLVGLPILLTSSIVELFGAPTYEVYAGFSGTLYGLFAYAALKDALNRNWIGGVVFAALVIKILMDWDQPETGDAIAVFAHVGGAIGAVSLVFAEKLALKRNTK